MSNLTRGWENLFKTGQDTDYNNLSYFANNNYSFSSFGNVGNKDDRIGDPQVIQRLCQNNPLLFGIFNRISDIIMSSGFEMFEIVKGNLKITKPALEYKRWLLDTGIKEDINNLLIASYSSGLGNALAYKIKNKGKIQYIVDPFLKDGKYRVEVKADEHNITEYRIKGKHDEDLYVFKPDEVYHYRHSNPDGNVALGTNGVLVASKILQLGYNILTFNSTHFGNNLNSVRMFGLDYALMEKIGYSGNDLDNMLKEMANELSQANGLRNANKTMLLKYPITDLTKEPQTNSQTRAVELYKEIIKKEVCHAMGVDENIFDIGGAKYDNAEKLQDQLYQQVKPTIIKIQDYVENWRLKQLDNNYNNDKFIFRFRRQFSTEEITLKETKDKQTQVYFNNLKIANEIYSDIGIKILPTPEKLKELEELQQMTFETINKEKITIKPAEDTQIADTFTQITNAESINRELEPNYWEIVENRLNKSFKAIFNV